MRKTLIVLLVLGLASLANAGSLKNRDSRQYHIEMRYPNGLVRNIIVAGNSTVSGFCPYGGCAILLLETRDVARVGANDEVQIFYGRLQVRRSRFR